MMAKLQSTSNISVLHVVDTIYTADSVEWCPNESCQHVFVCANYQLESGNPMSEIEPETNKRFGKIRLYSLSEENELKLHQVIDNDAVLDQKWCHNKINGYSYLGVVSAKNTLEIYKLDPELIELQLVTSISNKDSEILMLSLDWSTGKYSSEEPSIVTSDSKWNVSIFDFNNDKLTNRISWQAHTFEVWICAFYYWDTNIVFTGGDDAKLCKFDLRVGTTPILKSSAFNAGVTSIHSNKEREHILATGSYDSQLLLWDIRKMKCPLSAITMPDSVWRLKWNPNDYNYLLAACMRQGFHIVDFSNLENPDIVANYHEHEDIAYGVDWKYNKNDSDDFIIAACSFYDHKMSVAKVNLKSVT